MQSLDTFSAAYEPCMRVDRRRRPSPFLLAVFEVGLLTMLHQLVRLLDLRRSQL